MEQIYKENAIVQNIKSFLSDGTKMCAIYLEHYIDYDGERDSFPRVKSKLHTLVKKDLFCASVIHTTQEDILTSTKEILPTLYKKERSDLIYRFIEIAKKHIFTYGNHISIKSRMDGVSALIGAGYNQYRDTILSLGTKEERILFVKGLFYIHFIPYFIIKTTELEQECIESLKLISRYYTLTSYDREIPKEEIEDFVHARFGHYNLSEIQIRER